MDANASSTSPPKYDTEAWYDSTEGLCFWNWKTDQRQTIDLLERLVAEIEDQLKDPHSDELIKLKGRMTIINQDLAKSPGETRNLWNRQMYVGEYLVYND